MAPVVGDGDGDGVVDAVGEGAVEGVAPDAWHAARPARRKTASTLKRRFGFGMAAKTTCRPNRFQARHRF
jgi:hypothetical protein